MFTTSIPRGEVKGPPSKTSTVLAMQVSVLKFYQLDPLPLISRQCYHGKESHINGNIHTESNKDKFRFKQSYLVCHNKMTKGVSNASQYILILEFQQ